MILYTVLFLLSGKYKKMFHCLAGFLILFLLVNRVMPALPHLLSFLLSMVIIFYILYPSFIGVDYIISTTTVGELTAALQHMHIPEEAVLMLDVVLRFLPAVRQETKAIHAAMKLRDIHGIGRKIELIYVPLLINISQTAEELGDSITARGIENPARKTSWHVIGFHWQDFLVLIFCIFLSLISWKEGTIL